ncbi:YgdI/YgdR family lipoprotein, partial [Pseudomonas aeruginosa]
GNSALVAPHVGKCAATSRDPLKFITLFAALLLTTLAGCDNQPVVTLQDGSEILLKDQPVYDKYNYYNQLEQLNGDTNLI